MYYKLGLQEHFYQLGIKSWVVYHFHLYSILKQKVYIRFEKLYMFFQFQLQELEEFYFCHLLLLLWIFELLFVDKIVVFYFPQNKKDKL